MHFTCCSKLGKQVRTKFPNPKHLCLLRKAVFYFSLLLIHQSLLFLQQHSKCSHPLYSQYSFRHHHVLGRGLYKLFSLADLLRNDICKMSCRPSEFTETHLILYMCFCYICAYCWIKFWKSINGLCLWTALPPLSLSFAVSGKSSFKYVNSIRIWGWRGTEFNHTFTETVPLCLFLSFP